MKKTGNLKGRISKYFGEQVEVKMRMARLVFLMGFFGLVIDLIYNFFFMKQTGINILTPAVGMVALTIAFWISTAIDDSEKIFFVLLLLANTTLFPVAFLYGGVFRSGEVIWMLVGQLLVFLLLNGWRFYVCLGFSFTSMIATYIISIKIMGQSSMAVPLTTMAISSLVSLITVTLWSGLLYRYQNSIYEKQKKLAEDRADEVEQSAASQSMFFANMSHEIRTPINTIIGLNEMTLREDISDEIAENAINIQNASKMLLAIINDILDLSKIESGKMDIVPVQYETSSMFSDLVNIIWVKANQKKLDFKIDIAEDIPSMLYGDDVRIKQVLTNILNNAVKYTEKGSVTLTVTGEQLDNNLIRLKMVVEDTGIGIKKTNY